MELWNERAKYTKLLRAPWGVKDSWLAPRVNEQHCSYRLSALHYLSVWPLSDPSLDKMRALVSKLRSLSLIHCIDKLLIAYTMQTWSKPCPAPQKPSFILMINPALHSWLIHLIFGSRSVNLLSASEDGRKKDGDVTRMSTLRSQGKHRHTSRPWLCCNPKSWHLMPPHQKTHNGTTNANKTQENLLTLVHTRVHSRTHAQTTLTNWFKSQSYWSADDYDPLFDWGRERERHAESQIS